MAINYNFEILRTIITERRTTKVPSMNGKKIDAQQIEKLLGLANCAPTHGRTEPWRFFVYEGEAFERFCADHAEMYWKETPEETRNPQTYENLKGMFVKASHLVVVAMRRTPDTKIPEIEEVAAVSASVQNMLLGAEALGIAAIWSTGGMALKPAMKQYLGLAASDHVLAFVYMGYTDQEKKEMVRNIPLSEKVIWK